MSAVTLLDAAAPRRAEQVEVSRSEALILDVLLQRERARQLEKNEGKGT